MHDRNNWCSYCAVLLPAAVVVDQFAFERSPETTSSTKTQSKTLLGQLSNSAPADKQIVDCDTRDSAEHTKRISENLLPEIISIWLRSRLHDRRRLTAACEKERRPFHFVMQSIG